MKNFQKITDVISLNKRTSRIALIIVIALLMQIFMPIMNTYAAIVEGNNKQAGKLYIYIYPEDSPFKPYKELLMDPTSKNNGILHYNFDLTPYIKENYKYISDNQHHWVYGNGVDHYDYDGNNFTIDVIQNEDNGDTELWIELTRNTVTLNKNNTSVTVGAAQADSEGKVKPNLTVKNGTTTLTSGTDYTVSYSNNTQKGQAKVTVIGTGNYEGSFDVPFIIYGISVTGRNDDKTDFIATTGTEITLPTIPLRDGYDSVWKNGDTEIAGGGKYTVTSSDIDFTIKDTIRQIAFDDNFVINISNPENLQYTGNKIIPEVTLTYNGEDLDESQFEITTNDDFSTVGEKNYTIALKDGSTYNLG